MRFNHNPVAGPASTRRRSLRRTVVSVTCAAPLLFAFLFLRAGSAPAQQGGGMEPPNVPKPIILPATNHPLDPNQVMQLRQQHEKTANYEAANIERKKQLNEDTAHLLALATELKAEVDKTNKDTLSLNVIRKANEIEKLAHDVREKMRLVVGQS